MSVRVHVLDRPERSPDRVLRYAEGPTGLIDVYAPTTHPRGLAVIIHGGFWRAEYDRVHLRPLAAALARDGLKVALPEYRRVGDEGGGWPGSLDDVVESIEQCGIDLGHDPADIVLAGHSAGGHLAALAAARLGTPPRRVVALAGVLDLAAAVRDSLSNGAAQDFLGRTDPPADLVAQADPLQTAVASDTVALHGGRDTAVPVDYSRRYARYSERVRLVVLDDADHFDLIDPLSAAYPAVAEALGEGMAGR